MSHGSPTPPFRPGGSAGAEGFTYPRQCDSIATQAQRHLVWAVAGGVSLCLLWAGLTSLDKVTRGAGRIVPQTRNQLIQHLEGGIVAEILVKEGQRVEAGTALIRIDNSFSRAEFQQSQLDIAAKRLQMLRLEAESRGETRFTVPDEMAHLIPQIVTQERSLFRARQDGLKAQLSVLDDQHRQKQLELAEMNTRWTSSQREREIVVQRVQSMRRLAKMGAVSNNELLDNERNLQQLEAKLAGLTHDIPRLEAAVNELANRRGEATLRFRAESEKEQRETSLQVAKLEEAISAMQDRSRRSEVVAPVAGVVNKLFVDTVGGVVKSGEPLVQLVPAEASVVVEARLNPQDRGQVWPGLPAVVKVSAYDFALYGGLKGKVLDISPDALSDEKGEPYFRVRLEADASQLGPRRPVIPGMLAQVDIISGQHSILAYLMKPVQRLRDEALRQ
jgi:membrane fusion protein, adhesin transport system